MKSRSFRAPFYSITALAIGLVTLAAGPTQNATGVLYGIEGGLVGSAEGRFFICANGRILTLHYRGSEYREPLRNSGFMNAESENIGAVWTVWFHSARTNGGEQLELDRAVFLGHFDEDIHIADKTVRGFFTLLAQRHYGAAYSLLGPDIRSKEPLGALVSSMRSVNFSSYLQFGANVTCTSVKHRGRQRVKLLVDLAWIEVGNPGSVVMEVKRDSVNTRERYIDRIDPLVAIFTTAASK